MTGGDDENELITRAAGGDRAAYEVLLGRCVRPATRLAFAMLHDRSSAEDAFQEAALRAWRRLGNLRPGSLFRPWFVGIVANQCRELRRGRWWTTIRLPDLGRDTAAPDPVADWLEGEDLRRAVSRLPHDQKVAIILHFQLDMPLREVATALGITQAGVKTRINRALKRLRPAMTAAEVKIDG